MNTLESLVADYLDMLHLRSRAKTTITNYRYTLNYFLRFLAEHAPDRLDSPERVKPRDVTRFLAWRKDAGAAESSVVKHYSDLSSFWNWVVYEEDLPKNPMHRVERPSLTVKPVPVVSPDTLRKLLALESKTALLTKRNRAMILVLLDTGVRAGELVSMRLDGVDFQRQTVRVDGKTGVRDVAFGKATAVALRRYLRARKGSRYAGTDALWVGDRGPIGYAGVQLTLARYSERAGVGHIHPHQFRHTFAASWKASGGSEGDLMTLGGWRTAAQLHRYGAVGKAERARKAHSVHSPVDRL